MVDMSGAEAVTLRDQVFARSKILPGNHVHPGSPFPSQYPGTSHLVPGVFSPSGWVHRSVSTKELGQLWDLPVVVQKHLRQGSLVPSFMGSAPGKVLWHYASRLVE